MADKMINAIIEFYKLVLTSPTFIVIYLIAVVLSLFTMFLTKRKTGESFLNFIKRMSEEM